MKKQCVVVGNGMVGHHLVEQLMPSDDVDLIVIGAESEPAYDRVHLSEMFSGKSAQDLLLADPQQYKDANVELVLGDTVTQVNRQAQTVTTEQGRKFRYDCLILATGSYPFVPPVEGNDLPGCLVYRTLNDLEAIKQAAAGKTRGVVVGGGLLGLECANALKNLGLETSVVEFAPGLMGVQLDEEGSSCLQNHVEALGVSVLTSKATQQIQSGDDGLVMHFADETSLTTDVIVFSAGIRPWDHLARECGLDVGERGGVIVDQHCVTSDPNIMAIGECALYEGRIFGLVAPGYRMAEVAASRLLGGDGAFNGADMSTKLKLLGVQVGSIGDAHGATADSLSYTYRDPRKNTYLRLNVSADAKTVVGAVMVGDTERYDQVLQYFLNQLTLPEAPETLILPSGEGGPLLAADQLPMTAAICSCHNVTKGAVIDVMADGHLALGDIKAITKASSGCGGCAALLKTVVDDELTRLGVEVDQSICEHFKFTRQELFHLCQVNEIRSFEELLGSHGQGRGCDICKPAVASILASLHNEYVLKQPLVGLQDTNDHMLANIQKNGTYSVVPRIAGGEITPDKLIVLGQVAKKYDLYTKITGGQRIDLFGARVHELPLIWKELVDAGFETGHAYGKSLRTVKSCVGSTWCRYGVQDSVAMALFLENRYKGLRSPHKLKFAVSGCTRECAEAQSKDVGVIATEGGWNLFVGGNGGMRPRHAELFATDLDDETLVRYIDRFLMFYVRSADRLQRTSVWVESLEGGLGYLQEVVIEDSLGLAVELENQMLRVVDTYQCEWKTTIEDPEQLKRFQTYVNSDAADSDVIFVRERGQRRPITEDERRVPLTELIENAG